MKIQSTVGVFSKIRLVLNNKYVLEQDVKRYDYAQVLYKASEINRMCHLRLRKMAGQPRYARIINGKWRHHTRIELVK